MLRKLAPIVVCAALLLTAAGCQAVAEKATQTAVEKATGVKVEKDGGSVTMTGKDGKQVTISGGDKTLPANLPADFPVYQPSTVDGSSSAETNEGATYTFTLLTTDPVKTVLDWYKTQLGEKGWSTDKVNSVDVGGVQSGNIQTKKDKAEAMISIGGDPSKGDKVSVVCIVNVKK